MGDRPGTPRPGTARPVKPRSGRPGGFPGSGPSERAVGFSRRAHQVGEATGERNGLSAAVRYFSAAET